MAKNKSHSLIEIKKSDIHGMGLFAKENISWGTFIIEYSGEKITKKESARREKFCNSINTTYLFELDDNCDLDGMIGGNESKFINHSPINPNVCAIRRNGKIELYAYDNIKKGDELLLDYDQRKI